MESGVKNIDEYLRSDLKQKFEYLYENFPIMLPIIKNYKDELIADVIDMKESKRRAEIGEPGVRIRVQGCQAHELTGSK